MSSFRSLIGVVLCVALSGAPALAQAGAIAVTQKVAPIYLRADATMQPLRTATVGTTLKVLATAGEWVNVEFNDPQLGPRVGWVQRSLLQINDPTTTPMDLSVPREPQRIRDVGEREAADLGRRDEPIPVRLVDDDDTPGRGMMITGTVLLAVGIGLVALEAAYECHYGDFEYCSDEDKVLLVGGTALVGVGAALAVSGGAKGRRPAPPRAQLRYTVRF
jgi:hypothetical protein